MHHLFLSYPINSKTPTYGNNTVVSIEKLKSIYGGSTVNESLIHLPLHAGTHIDFPKHFYDTGQTISDYSIDFWICQHPLIITANMTNSLQADGEIIDQLESLQDKGADILIIKFQPHIQRRHSDYWEFNYGISVNVAKYLKRNFQQLKMIGFNAISLTSYQHRAEGKAAHLEFLKPKKPILIIEDMDLSKIDENSIIKKILVSPLMVENVDGVPVTVWAELEN